MSDDNSQPITSAFPGEDSSNLQNVDGREKIESDEFGNETLDEENSPSVKGEQSVSGDMTDPASDDDVLKNAHDVGIALDEDSENPQELDIAEDVEEAEEAHQNN